MIHQSRLSITSQFSNDQSDTKSTAFEAPPLTTTEIIDCLAEVGLEPTHHDLLHPTSGRICLLYKCLLQLIFYEDGTQQENERQADGNVEGTDLDSNSELWTLLTVFNKMKYVLTRLHSRDFKFVDLTHPEPTRVAKTLSVIINYLKFCDLTRKEFEALAAQEDAILLETQKQQDELYEIRQRNQEKRQRLHTLDPLNELEGKLDQLQQDLQSTEQTMQLKADELAQIKLTRQSLKDTLQAAQFTAMNAIAEIKTLERRSEIDYPLLLSKIEAAEKKLDDFEKAVTTEKQQLDTLTKTKERQSECFESISKAYNMKTQMVNDLKNLDRLNTAVNNIKDKLHDLDTKLDKLAGDKLNIETKIKGIDTARTDLYAQRDKKREAIAIHMTKLQNDHQKTLLEVAETRKETQECLESNHQMLLESQKLKNDYTDYIAKRSLELRRLEERLSSRNDQLDALISG